MPKVLDVHANKGFDRLRISYRTALIRGTYFRLADRLLEQLVSRGHSSGQYVVPTHPDSEPLGERGSLIRLPSM